MALVHRAIGRTLTLNAADPLSGTNQYLLGDVSDGIVGVFSIQFANLGTFVGSITVQGRTRAPQADDDNAPFEALPYLDLYLNGAVGLMTWSSVPITDNSIIFVPASGLEITLNCTVTSGWGRVYWTPCVGAVGYSAP